MYLFTVVMPLAIQAAVVHAVPTGLPTKYAYERDVGHGGPLTVSTVSTVEAAPTIGIHNRDLDSGKLQITLFNRNAD
jgi:hypothetical protein